MSRVWGQDVDEEGVEQNLSRLEQLLRETKMEAVQSMQVMITRPKLEDRMVNHCARLIRSRTSFDRDHRIDSKTDRL